MKTLISNPPYNMNWKHPEYVSFDSRFSGIGIPPEKNANWAFILTALAESDISIFLLPAGMMTGGTTEERKIKEYLINNNFVDYVVQLPGNMFVNTSVNTCILGLSKKKTTSNVMMIDASQEFVEEIREQKGQFGIQTSRIYTKKYNILSDENIKKIILAIKNHKEVQEFSKLVTLKQIKEKKLNLQPSVYQEIEYDIQVHRELKDVIKDYNEIIKEKNTLKLTINETLAQRMGIDKTLYTDKLEDLNSTLKDNYGLEILKEDYITFSKNKNEFKFENKNKEQLSEILLFIFQSWKQKIFNLNNKSNSLLLEMRDILLAELMSGNNILLENVNESGGINELQNMEH